MYQIPASANQQCPKTFQTQFQTLIHTRFQTQVQTYFKYNSNTNSHTISNTMYCVSHGTLQKVSHAMVRPLLSKTGHMTTLFSSTSVSALPHPTVFLQDSLLLFAAASHGAPCASAVLLQKKSAKHPFDSSCRSSTSCSFLR